LIQAALLKSITGSRAERNERSRRRPSRDAAAPEPDREKVVKLPPSPRTKADVTPEERGRSLAALDEATRQLDETVFRRKHG
jgi:hypothetical protein